MSKVFDVIKQRSSIRAYTAEAVTEEEKKLLVTAALAAPTAVNRQEWHFIFAEGVIINELEKCQIEITLSLQDKEMEKRLQDRNYKTYYDAPLLIIITVERDFKWGKVDAGIAVANLALVSEDIGLGSVIIGSIAQVFESSKGEYFKERLQFPENHEFAIAIAIGHKATSTQPHELEEGKVTFIC